MSEFNFRSQAFAPFYDDHVSISGTRPDRTVATTCRACVFDQGFEDPLADGGTASLRRRFSIHVRIADWPEVDPPQNGDQVLLEQGDELAVFDVSRSFGDYVLEARTC